jgi:predicted RNA binding protein with dsRBD fold (UPF0201 family)
LRAELRGRVGVEATVSPSEDDDKVATAVRNVVGGPEASLVMEQARVKFVSEDLKCLEHLRGQLRDRHVRSAARKLMLAGKIGTSTRFMLNKQAAVAGVLAVCSSPEESPLGPIYLTIDSEQIDEVIEWLTAYESG